MRSILTLLILICGPLLHAAEAHPLPTALFENLHAGKTQTVVVYGTSLTEFGPWVKQLQEWFNTAYPGKVKVINSGGSGQNSQWGVVNVKAKVVDLHPDLVFIEFAINDAHVKFKITPEQSLANLTTIVSAITKGDPQTGIVLQTMNAAIDAPPKTAGTDRPKLADYYANYVRFATQKKLPLIEHFPLWSKLAHDDAKKFLTYAPDGLHPNEAGIKALTWPDIEALLKAADKASKK